ncbi:hypothetical protein E2C01_094366 [Portunus trituberculatus]|uniref:Uncharacterized protein n=1 Tax=Portunus trituberculatus TaxID=210409 RepID=A0A5B7K2W4_PORTR|nr:hypothetical protein [Portunus trituberculatus]
MQPRPTSQPPRKHSPQAAPRRPPEPRRLLDGNRQAANTPHRKPGTFALSALQSWRVGAKHAASPPARQPVLRLRNTHYSSRTHGISYASKT